MSNFLVQQQGGNKNRQEDKQWIPTVMLYLFNIRMAILKGAQVWDFDVLDFKDFFYHEVFIGRGHEGWNKIFTFFTDR